MGKTETRCPKCGVEVVLAVQACPRCGLARSRWDSFTETPPSEALAAGWAECEAGWSEPARHDRLLDIASNGGELGLLARSYRLRQATQSDDPIAARQLVRIGVLVETAARAQAQSASLGGKRAMRVAWAIGYALAGLLLGGSGYIVYRVFTRH